MTFLVVHVGAGNHSPARKDQYKKLLKTALHSRSFIEASNAVEGSPLTNTGYGSALDKLGNASCDCTIYEYKNGISDILCLIGIDDKKHPTEEAFHIKEELDKELRQQQNQGLSVPAILQYPLIKSMLGTTGGSGLISRDSQALYDFYKSVPQEPTQRQPVQDTVGVIHLGKHFCMGTSSGGTFLKIPGRVSCAGVYGAGSAVVSRNGLRVSCLCSGNGDDIIRMRLAGFLAEILVVEAQNEDFPDFSTTMVKGILDQSQTLKLSGTNCDLKPIIYVGAIAIIEQKDRNTLAYCHSTESFYFGFVDGKDHIEVVQSTHDDINNAGTFVSGQYKL